ncbi:hypothetical protein [Phreatobacter sp.]|uniref:hypothetical protein n=1 Tax=Phreatobacter sp. TaxID=1966341 RepID=UPI0025D53E30|nr:hypothetical protein [Phreatobacter sp.]
MTTAAIALPPAVAKFPVLGWMVNDAVTGRDDAKYYFIGNVLLTIVLAVYLFGYPLLIVLALAAAALALTTIVIFTAADMFENRRPRRPTSPAARPKR